MREVSILAKYERGDTATFYFVVVKDKNGGRIQAWTDNKELAKSYMEFHKCKQYKLKSVTNKVENIYNILDENLHDEIQIANLTVRNPGSKRDITKFISVPMTRTEMMMVNSETSSFLVSRIGYSELEEYFMSFKKKYRNALENLFLLDVMMSVIHSQNTPTILNLELDQLMVLLKSFPDHFGV